MEIFGFLRAVAGVPLLRENPIFQPTNFYELNYGRKGEVFEVADLPFLMSPLTSLEA